MIQSSVEGHQFVPGAWSLGITLLGTFTHKFSGEHVSFLLGMYLARELLGHTATPCLAFQEESF